MIATLLAEALDVVLVIEVVLLVVFVLSLTLLLVIGRKKP